VKVGQRKKIVFEGDEITVKCMQATHYNTKQAGREFYECTGCVFSTRMRYECLRNREQKEELGACSKLSQEQGMDVIFTRC